MTHLVRTQEWLYECSSVHSGNIEMPRRVFETLLLQTMLMCDLSDENRVWKKPVGNASSHNNLSLFFSPHFPNVNIIYCDLDLTASRPFPTLSKILFRSLSSLSFVMTTLLGWIPMGTD